MNAEQTESIESFIDLFSELDRREAREYLAKTGWELTKAVNLYIEENHKEKSKPLKKIANFIKGTAKEINKLITGHEPEKEDSFNKFVEHLGIAEFPKSYELKQSKVKEIVIDQRKTALIYLHDKRSGLEFVYNVLSSDPVRSLISDNFVFFTTYNDSKEGQEAKKNYSQGRTFALAVIKNAEVIAIQERAADKDTISTFLLSSMQKYENPLNQSKFFPNFENSQYDKDLEIALELSRNSSMNNQVFESENFFEGNNYNDLEMAIELSKNSSIKDEDLEIAMKMSLENNAPNYDGLDIILAESLRLHEEEKRQRGIEEICRSGLAKPSEVQQNPVFVEEVKLNQREPSLVEEANEPKESALVGNEGKVIDRIDIEEKIKLLGDEPEMNSESCVMIFRLPDGQKIDRRFKINAEISTLYLFIEIQGYRDFIIFTGLPVVILGEGTIESNGLAKGAVCHVRFHNNRT